MDKKFIDIIVEASGRDRGKINPSSTLLGDLGIDGDDAWDIFELCYEKYGVDFSEFDFDRYFRNEPCFKGLIYLYRKLKYKDEHVASMKEPISISELYDACVSGKWGSAYNKSLKERDRENHAAP